MKVIVRLNKTVAKKLEATQEVLGVPKSTITRLALNDFCNKVLSENVQN